MATDGVDSKIDALKLTEEQPIASTGTSEQKVEGAQPTGKPGKKEKEAKDQKSASKSKGDKPAKAAKQQQQPKAKAAAQPELIGITVKKNEDLSEWYQQTIIKGDLLEFTDIPGCYIYQPGSYRIWEFIQEFFNKRIRKMGVKNCYFPLFISEANLQREKDHIEGFAAEVAWVTEGGKNKLEKRLAVRPTSETAMYSFYSKKIRSHRDLPLKMNQWNNVVRWEFKHPMPFIRSREFLWQEGHTAHLTEKEAGVEVRQILDHYAAIYEELLAVPVVKGVKTVNEQFPGAHYTTTVEGFIPAVGRGIQAGTSHCLGQHFAKMFDIRVEDPHQQVEEGKPRDRLYVWQNSWGFTTRSIGLMILIHGDDKGLVIPPRVADVQVVIVPVGVTAKTTDVDRAKLYDEVKGISDKLEAADVRVECDMREGYSPGYKFNDWEMKGVPLRLEFGPKDSANGVVTTSRRDQDGKSTLPITDLAKSIPELLETIQADMLRKASEEYASHRKIIRKWEDFVPSLNAKNVVLVQHCATGACEDEIKKDSSGTVEGQEVDVRAPSMGAKSLCIPDEQPEEVKAGTRCINPKCDREAKMWVMFGRSY
ncbi:hypothetical protein LTR62_005966 [Meristemomyces frigidus]|uniref:proline--tRNA ligase n=1 Tax=Meristemomyces frigidus TaxID=1508187 RepID=A0AAN7TW25_9PEZI|nr:hypothetical protein LTR62_005966 [Meristemomyces frigidus]